MLKTLKFEVEFAHTGKKLSGAHDFEKGMTAITGANESGKSMRLEMFRYAWFGSRALRSQMSTYKTLHVSSQIELSGVVYEVTRSPHSVKLKKGKADLASGTKAVNEAVVRLFGYDLDVFDVSNACLQGEVEALTNKTPVERKKMVDSTIGLDAIDDMIKEYMAEISATNRVIETISANAGVEPIPPEPVTDPLNETELFEAAQKAKTQVARKQAIEVELSVLKCECPQEPEQLSPHTLEELYALRTERDVVKAKAAMIKSELANIRIVDVSPIQMNIVSLKSYLDTQGYEAWDNYNEWKRQHDQHMSKIVTLTADDLNNIMTAYKLIPTHIRIKELENSSVVNCPHCKGDFSLNHSEVETLKQSLPADGFPIEEWIAKAEANGIRSRMMAETQLHMLEEQTKFFAEPKHIEPSFPYLGSKREAESQLANLETQVINVTRAQDLLVEVKNLEEELGGYNTLQIEEKIKQKELDIKAMNEYTAQKDKFEVYGNKVLGYSAELEALKFCEATLEEYTRRWDDLRMYNVQYKNYEAQKATHDKVNQQIIELNASVDQSLRIRKALNELKPKVKSYLLPSLSRVASNFLSEMTNGQRNRIDIDHNFEIMVDGQPVETLSGSGKAVANLSVRLGLGTVLTNKVFSVLFADEVDASMDDERAAYTAQCLRNLTKVFNQIILVSHQKPQADHYIEL